MNMEVTLVKFVRQALQIRVECVRSVTSFLWQSTACRDAQKNWVQWLAGVGVP